MRLLNLLNQHAFIAIVFLGFALRLLWIGRAPLWYDEAGSVWMASLPWPRMIAATAGDAHPPFYLAMLWAWMRLFGSSEVMVRLPSAFFSALCTPVTYVIAKRLQLSRAVSLVAAGLMALLPAQLWYAQEARMYSLLSLEIGLAFYAALSPRWWLFGLALTSAYWTHNYGLLFAIPLNVTALYTMRKTEWQRWDLVGWLWSNAIAFGLWLPWLNILAGQMRQVAGGYWLQPVTAGGLLYSIYMIAWAFAPGQALQAHAALLLFGIAIFAVWRALRLRSRPALLCLGFALGSFLIPIAISAAWHPVLLFRALLPAWISLCILFAWACIDGIDLRRRLLAGATAAPTIVMAIILYYMNVPAQKGDSQILRFIDFKPGDVVYHVNDGSLQIAHIYAPASWPQYELPADNWRDIGALSPATRQAYGVQSLPLEELSWNRAWVIYAANPMTAAAEDQALRALLWQYVHEIIYERADEMSHQAVYLLWNYRLEGGVP